MQSEDPTLWPVGTGVRVVKLAVSEDALFQTCSWEDWKPGQLNAGSPPVDYELWGRLIRPLQIGKPILLARTQRNHVKGEGIFVSTPVREFKNGAAITRNSIYFISRFEPAPLV
jgi:hypothetical protein